MLPRYFTYSAFVPVLQKSINDILNIETTLYELNQSVNGETILGLKLGNGKRRILAWSNMHGNETTTTRALLEFLKRKDLSSLLEGITLYIIPVLNPDGLNAWTRFNANQIDLNRDAINLSQPESRVLRKVFEGFKPHLCFNLHDQRTIYGDVNGDLPAQLSFLAPAASNDRAVTASRLKSMYIINKIYQKVEPFSTGMIGRYDDAFNLNCVGDYFQSCEVPTVLFEAGHAGHDYYREEAVNLIVISIVEALLAFTIPNVVGKETILEDYLAISPISQNFTDILVKNMVYGMHKADIAIQYHEMLLNDILYFVPMVVGINNKDIKNAHRVLDMDNVAEQPVDLSVSGDLVVTCPSLDVLTFH